MILLINVFFVKRFAAIKKEKLKYHESFTQMVNGTIRGKMSMRTMSACGSISEKIDCSANYMYMNENSEVKLATMRGLSLEFFSTICGSLMAPFACVLAAMGIIPLAAVVLIAQLCRYLIMYTSGFGIALANFKVDHISYERLQGILNLQREDDAQNVNVLIESKNDEPVLECKNVCISYDNKNILTDVNLNIKRGEIVVLCGESGSGKSSITKAILGL